ncbi:hypothetical protein [Pseudomonas sp.]|uniref:hypothetical protein n=1 Tax=Pseudomonas sp. TaxID=306 RepID=UPI0028B00FC9|nr:hypothetical protein [Pseudomonas sp.]
MKPVSGISELERGIQWVHPRINVLAVSGKLDFLLNRKPGQGADRMEVATTACAAASFPSETSSC